MAKIKSFQRNLFITVGGIFILYAICFVFYQYNREKEFRVTMLESRLQANNREVMITLGDSINSYAKLRDYVANHDFKEIRITIIGADGHVISDSRQKDVSKMSNHLGRSEVRKALKRGEGYDMMRESETTNEVYFYYATRFKITADGDEKYIVIRSAMPYSDALNKTLDTDSTYLYFASVITFMLGLVLYHNTKRISNHVNLLRRFAKTAEHEQTLDSELDQKLPDDELGEISHTIISLYWKLRNAEEEKARIKRQLTQNAAHELKTPAASIHGYLETILSNPDLADDKRQHFLERCYAQSDRMCRLLQDMSTLTKLDGKTGNNRLASSAVEVDVKNIIESVIDDTSLELQCRGITPRMLLPDAIKIYGDSALFYSIFRNIIDNTIAYAARADYLQIECREINNVKDKSDGRQYKSYEFVISDNGVGVAFEHQARIFERFYRIEKGRSRKMGGTGLGLAIVKNAVAAHGGVVTAETTAGGGLTIRFTLCSVL